MPIFFDENNKTFYLESANTSYVFYISPEGFLSHLYYGKKISRDNLVPLLEKYTYDPIYVSKKEENLSINFDRYEYPTFGLGDYREVALKLTRQDGSRNNNFKYKSHVIRTNKTLLTSMPCVRENNNELEITLTDNDITLKLFYSVYENEDCITRRTEVINNGTNQIDINYAFSGNIDIEGTNYDLIHFPGFWARERDLHRTHIDDEIIRIESKAGVTSNFESPFIAISDKSTTEYQGRAFGFNLVYSGSFSFKIQQTIYKTLRIIGGINDFDFNWTLNKEEVFQTPELVLTYSDIGFNKMSQNLHDLYRNHLINPNYVNKSRPIVINSWESAYFQLSNEKLFKIIDKASTLGIDTFVLDDGWFKNRYDDTKGLGDWEVDDQKLEGGLEPLINHTIEKGMKFGLWIEPEMANADSNLYRNHPEFFMESPNGYLNVGRNQLVLDLSNPKVVDYQIEVFSNILRKYNISYIKWDFNRFLTEYYGKSLKPTEQSSVLHRFILGAYRIMDELINKRFPHIFFEGCAGGGGRLDPATLYYFPHFWCSDNTDPYMRERIQYATSFAYPLSSFSGHVSASPNHQTGRVTPLQSRMDVASFCITGYELDLTKLEESELEQIKENVKRYKSIENLILHGDLYRLVSPFDSDHFGQIVVSKDKSEAFAIVGNKLFVPREPTFYFKLIGLDQNAKYSIVGTNLVYKGDVLTNFGLPFNPVSGDFVTKTYILKKVNE